MRALTSGNGSKAQIGGVLTACMSPSSSLYSKLPVPLRFAPELSVPSLPRYSEEGTFSHERLQQATALVYCRATLSAGCSQIPSQKRRIFLKNIASRMHHSSRKLNLTWNLQTKFDMESPMKPHAFDSACSVSQELCAISQMRGGAPNDESRATSRLYRIVEDAPSSSRSSSLFEFLLLNQSNSKVNIPPEPIADLHF